MQIGVEADWCRSGKFVFAPCSYLCNAHHFPSVKGPKEGVLKKAKQQLRDAYRTARNSGGQKFGELLKNRFWGMNFDK